MCETIAPFCIIFEHDRLAICIFIYDSYNKKIIMYAYAYVFFTSPLDLIIFESFWKEGLYKKIKMFMYINIGIMNLLL